MFASFPLPASLRLFLLSISLFMYVGEVGTLGLVGDVGEVGLDLLDVLGGGDGGMAGWEKVFIWVGYGGRGPCMCVAKPG